MHRLLLLILAFFWLNCHEKSRDKNQDITNTKVDSAKDEIKALQNLEAASAEKNYDNLGEKLGTISFEVKSEKTKDYENGIQSWVSIAEPEKDLTHLIKKDEIVVQENKVKILIDYPLTSAYSFELASPNGFSREQLLKAISENYYKIYDEEEQTASVKTIPVEKRTKMYNRNQTNGKYGIWGHDITDLVLADILVYRVAGHLLLVLNIES